MAKVAITESYLQDIADAIREKTGLTNLYYPSQMAPAIMTISGSGGITPTGTISITTNGTYNVTQYASASVNVPTGSTINNQNKSVTPTKAQQQVTYDNGYTGLGIVTVNAIPANYIIPTGNKEITENGTAIDVTEFATVSVDVPTGSTINNQNKTISPSTSQQTVTFDSGYTGLGTVTVNAMPSITLPTSAASSATSGYTSKATIGRSTSDQYINIGTGYNAAGAYYKISAVANGTAGTPTATKGTVSNHQVNVTPSVTNTTGYITGSTKTGTAVTVTASELASGNKAITENGTGIDVVGYSTVSVNVSNNDVWKPVQAQTRTIVEDPNGNYLWYDNTTPAFAEGQTWRVTWGNETYIVQTKYVEIDSVGYWVIGNPGAIGYTDDGTGYSWIAWNQNSNAIAIGTPETGSKKVILELQQSNPYQAKTVTYTPSETQQTATVVPDSGYNGLSTVGVTVNAISSTYVGSGIARKSSTDLTVSGATVTAPAGYYAEAASKSVSSMTLPTAAASSATSGYTSKATIGRSTAAQYINISPGYNSAGAYYVISAVANGSATAPASISGTAASVSTGTNTLTLTKTVSVTPTVSAGYVSSGTAGNSSVSLTASVTTKASTTYHPSLTDQTISASQYLTGAQTIKAVTITNLTAANIKKDVVVKIGDSTDDDCVTTITGTYEGSGGGAALTVDTSTATLSSAATSISFTGLAGEPTSFAVVSAADLATGASPWKTAAVVFDGTSLHGQTIRNTSNAQVTYDGSSFSKTYSNGTLTITGSGTNFQANQYKLVYTYGGSDIGTADVQVGSGATSITFTGLEEEPSYFSCIFKSNFSTSSGYQRVIVVVYDGTSTYGMEMDSSAKHSTAHWTHSYSSGSLTITSNGTNAGGYFHQPGYYQLTYATEGSGGNYQTKSATYYATSSQQTASIAADSGYDALKKVNITIAPVTTTNLIANNIVSGVTVQVGDAVDSDRITSVTGNVVLQHYYTGSSAPSSSTGSNGDLYLQS